MKISEEDLEKIPYGHYCYTIKSDFKLDNGKYGYEIELCPFYSNIKNKKYIDETISWCSLVKCEIDDQCKSCGEKYDFPPENN